MSSEDARPAVRQAVAESLRVADIPRDRWAVKGAGLGVGEAGLYWAILRAFPELGAPPDPAWLRATAADLGVDAEAALAELERRDLIVRQPTTGAIAAAYPFSGTPTSHQVQVAGARPVFAMCAVDALGIPFLLGRDATIVSADPISGAPVRVEVRGGSAQWDPPGAVVFIGTPAGDGVAAETRCPLVNFFRSAESADAYQRDRPGMQGRVLTLVEAVEAGRLVFGLTGDVSRASGPVEGGGPCCP